MSSMNGSCRICGSSDVRPAGEIRPYRAMRFSLVDCGACGSRFAPAEEEVFDQLHSSSTSTYASHGTRAATAYGFFTEGDVAGYRAWLARHVKYRFVLDAVERCPAGASVLEVGCSRGALTAYLRLRGYDAVGSDVSAAAREAAAGLFGPHFLSPEEALRSGRVYDVIVHTGTIGCVQDPVGLTEQLLAHLRPGGTLAFNAPNVAYAHKLNAPWPYSTPPPDLTAAFDATFWSRFASDAVRVDVQTEQEPASSWVRAWGRAHLGGRRPADPFSAPGSAKPGPLLRRIAGRTASLEHWASQVIDPAPAEYGLLVTMHRRRRPRAMPRPARWGIIGAGAIGRTHAQALCDLGDEVAFAALVEPDARRREQLASAFGPRRVYPSVDALCADGDLDMVSIATPPATHIPILRSLLAGLPPEVGILCEKPVAHTLAAADGLAQLPPDDLDRIGFIYQLRYSDDARRLRAIVDHQGLGPLLSAHVVRYEPHRPKADRAAWWGRFSDGGGGAVLQQLIHELDLLLLLMGPAQTVHARTHTMAYDIEAEDTLVADIGFSQGRASVTLLPTAARFSRQFDLHGTLGALHLPFRIEAADGQRQTLQALADQAARRHTPPGRSVRAVNKVKRKLRIPVPQSAPRSDHARLFADALLARDVGRPLPVPFEKARASLELAMAMYESALADATVTLPLRQDGPVYAGVDAETYREATGAVPRRASS